MATIANDASGSGSIPAPVPPSVPLQVNATSAGDEWETDSSGSEREGEEFMEDLLAADLDDWEYGNLPTDEACTREESNQLRKLLREVGVEQFIRETLMSGRYTALKLCSAFRVHNPGLGLNDEALYSLLGFALHRELSFRKRLEEYQTIDDAAKLLNSSKNIIIITGAGISTSLGIPDFRSKNTGFYSKLREMGIPDPESLFTLEEFDYDPTNFYKLAGDLLPVQDTWSPTHQFIKILQDKGKLLRNYTQNIDNVESYAGVNEDKIIHCHGSWKTATCRKCGHKVPGDQLFESLKAKQVARCKVCIESLRSGANAMKRKRSYQGSSKPRKKGDFDSDDDSEDDNIPEPGVMKPDITFFGENLPDRFYDTLNSIDREAVDLIIVIGTSMKVAPVSEIPQHVKNSVPQIMISRDPIKHIEFDISLLGDCDNVVHELCRRAGWQLQHKMTDPNEVIEVRQHPELEYTYTVTSPTNSMVNDQRPALPKVEGEATASASRN